MDEPGGGRIGGLIGAVLAEAVRVSHCDGIVILDDGSPEARWLIGSSRATVGADRVWAVRGDPGRDGDAGESLRYRGRLLALERNALTAHPANKTALLLGHSIPPEPLLPLGDLYATQIEPLAGGWSAPAEVLELADHIQRHSGYDRDVDIRPATGIYQLDAALTAMFEGWRPAEEAAEELPEPSRGPFLEAVRRGRFWRERAGLIPKLSTRTIGIDLFA
jgi:hypothetical protein